MKRQAWIDARRAVDLTQREVDRWLCARAPEREELWLDQTKLSRFERGLSADVSPVSLRLLAECYGTTLEAIDPEAAASFRDHRELVTALSEWTFITPDDGMQVAA